jgi:hypothetical protein
VTTLPEIYDPMLAGERHPILPAGYDSFEINGDDMDGSGVNFPVWTSAWESLTMGTPIALLTDSYEVFADCPTITIRGDNNTIVFPREVRTQPIGGA